MLAVEDCVTSYKRSELAGRTAVASKENEREEEVEEEEGWPLRNITTLSGGGRRLVGGK